MTTCAPLCGLAGIQRVTSRSPSQTPPCQKRVPGVRHPVNSVQPKVAGEPGGRKKCRIKAGGRLRAPRPATPPRRAGRGFSIGGRNFHFLLWQVVDIGKSREKTSVFRHSARWLSQVVFRDFSGDQCGGHFSLPGVKSGVSFSSALTAAVFSTGPSGDICEFQEEHHARRKNKFVCEPPLRHSNSSKRCVLWTAAVCSSSWRWSWTW